MKLGAAGSAGRTRATPSTFAATALVQPRVARRARRSGTFPNSAGCGSVTSTAGLAGVLPSRTNVTDSETETNRWGRGPPSNTPSTVRVPLRRAVTRSFVPLDTESVTCRFPDSRNRT